ncbi:hypothetical protein NQ317_010891 [Molorchus minor]|uniref:SWIM-type domain-containing protein n=1 Tax=Molorchus minor TaxID=1323400 RepID=A0ABQ9ISE5_9CUCU|nr:hypothetical protein NQ317_010891 [Molorchus minor]
MQSNYLKKLLLENKDVGERYQMKLKVIHNLDPFILETSDLDYSTSGIPPITNMDIVSYLVLTHSFYTKDQMKAFKSLEAYKYFNSGFVLKVGSKVINTFYVLVGKVKHSQRFNDKPLEVWCIVAKDGAVVTAHCTCMAGNSEVCSHVAAVLFAAEYANEKTALVSCTDVAASWPMPSLCTVVPIVLGPLLFLIYINDIRYHHECDFLHLFADDTLMAVTNKDLNLALRKMNESLIQIQNYLNTNKLKLNVAKTKAMVLTTSFKYNNINFQNLNISINTDTIEFITAYHSMLTLTTFTKKYLKKIYFFSRIAFNISPFSAITVYNTIILPHFDYCASILFAFTSNKILALQKLQNRCMRIILKCNRYTNITLMLDTLQWMSVRDRLYYMAMIRCFLFLNKVD